MRHRAMASSTLRCCHARCDPLCSQNLLPDCADDVGHLKGGPAHRFFSLLERFTRFRAGHLDSFQRTGNCLQMAPGQMEIDGCVVQLGVSEQHLDGAQIGAGLQHVSGKAMSKRVRGHTLDDAGAFLQLRPRLSR